MDFQQLKHFLTNKKAQRWIFYEWFYSDIDWCLLTRENEFQQCLEHFFPQIQSDKFLQINRKQRNFLRRRFGKPRRFSSAFLQTERKKVEKQRKLLQIVRYEKSTSFSSERIFLHQLPSTIICPLKFGQRVLVRFSRSNQISICRGTFLSTIENENSKCRIEFDDSSIGQLNVDENDVISEEPVKMIGLVELLKSMNFADDDDDELDLRILDDRQQTTNKRSDQITKIPDRLIFLIIRVSRILCSKRETIDHLRQLNDQAIYERAEKIPLSDDFRRHYAQLVQWLAKLNERLGENLQEINQICRDIVHDEQLSKLFYDTKFLCQRAERLAEEIVQRLNISSIVTNSSNLQLIVKLVGLAVQMKEFSESEGSFLELHSLDESNRNFQKFLRPSLLTTYKRCVETSLTQFKSGLNNRPGLGPLQAFLHPRTTSNDQEKTSSSNNQTFFSL